MPRLKLRRILSVTRGRADPSTWRKLLVQEAPVHGDPEACARCPLRPGGEWEANVIKSRPEMSPALRRDLSTRWGCHAADRPCAGMQRVMES